MSENHMENSQRMYACIDLRSFYASVECVDRGLDPLTTNLVVADPQRGRGTICLAVTPPLKAKGVPNRCRLFEIPSGIKYIMATPRMRRYMEVSADIYSLYLHHLAPCDIHPYSIDECFMDVTPYLRPYSGDPCSFVSMLRSKVLDATGISATAGLGTNLFLAKIALDIAAKKSKDGMAFLDESGFKSTLWFHRPITDIWNIGPGIARRLHKYSAFDLHDVAMLDEKLLYKEFGINAEYLIDHAWGQEPCTLADIKSYSAQDSSISVGQILQRDYSKEECRIVLKEMVDFAVLELLKRRMLAAGISLSLAYSHDIAAWDLSSCGVNSGDGGIDGNIGGDMSYRPRHSRSNKGRSPHIHSGRSKRFSERTCSLAELMYRFELLFDETVVCDLPIRRISIALVDLAPESSETPSLFTEVSWDKGTLGQTQERSLQDVVIAVKGRFGSNALLKGTSLWDAATARERNNQVGGHRA